MEESYQLPLRDRSLSDSLRKDSETSSLVFSSKTLVSNGGSGGELWPSQQYTNGPMPGYGHSGAPHQPVYTSRPQQDDLEMDSFAALPQLDPALGTPWGSVAKPNGDYLEEMMDDQFMAAASTPVQAFPGPKIFQPDFQVGPQPDTASPMTMSPRQSQPYMPRQQAVTTSAENYSSSNLVSDHYSPEDFGAFDSRHLLASRANVAPEYGPSPGQASVDSYNANAGGEYAGGHTPVPGEGLHMAELSPFTTNNSLTPSVSSVHSTQPSFFSAHQFLHRNSLDQGPPSVMHRPSVDLYSLRPSIDSQQSTPMNRREGQNGRYSSFTNSISNYIPFMNDRQRPLDDLPKMESPSRSESPAPKALRGAKQLYQDQQSRHLIRSIFKSSGTSNVNNADQELAEDLYSSGEPFNDFIVTSPKEEMEIDFPDKKLKRSKRSIFTRFKTPVKSETIDPGAIWPEQDGKMDIKPDPEAAEMDAENVLLNENYYEFMPSTMEQAPLEDSIAPGAVQREPDYGALFHNVGKRRVTKAKQKPKLKPEPGSEADSGFNSLNSFDSKIKRDPSMDLDEKLVARRSNNPDYSNLSAASDHALLASEVSKSSHEFPESEGIGSGIASASKRILGLKLMSKKRNNVPRPAVEIRDTDDEADVDDLGLTEENQLLATNDAKSRIRGRKENKEADLVDKSKIFVCSYCSRRFKRQEHLKRHFRSLHTHEKPYDCEICHKKFSRNDNLNQHLKIHKLEGELVD